MVPVDFTIISKEIDRYGEPVNIEVYSNQSYSDYGDKTTQTSTIYSVQAIFNTYGLSQRYDPEGVLGEVRYSFFFKASQTGVNVDNVIVRADGSRWKINKASNHGISGNMVVSEAVVTNG